MKNLRLVDGETVETKKKMFTGCNMFEVEVGTTGYQGGDSGHGCRTFISFSDAGGTDMSVEKIDEEYGNGSVILTFGGDSELSQLIKALKFVRKHLKKQIQKEGRKRCML